MHELAADLALIGLGANLGDAPATLRAAVHELDRLPRTGLRAVSGLWRSAPLDASGPDYCNAVAELRTGLSAEALLDHLLRLELRHGRRRPPGVRHAPRTIDLDLLCLGRLHRQGPRLSLPHPRMHERAFVLAPLQEIHPDWQLPDGEPIAQALLRLRRDGQQLQRVGSLLASAL